MDEYGFVITRYISRPEHDLFWKECYDCIRKFYPNHQILIIDDNSNQNLIDRTKEQTLTNCQIVQSEYHQRGELLAHYYFHKLHPFKKAFYLQDKIFIKKPINFESTQDVIFLMHFKNIHENKTLERKLITDLKDGEYIGKFYDEGNWYGCCGTCAVVSWDFLDMLNKKHNFFEIMLQSINCRNQRLYFERAFGCLADYYCHQISSNPSIFGDRLLGHNYPIAWHQYLHIKDAPEQALAMRWIGVGR